MHNRIFKKIQWYVNRLRAMSPGEPAWRVAQQMLQRKERKRFTQRRDVTSGRFYDSHDTGIFQSVLTGVHACERTPGYTEGLTPRLLAGYRYADFKRRWHAGFQSGNDWPMEFSHDMTFKQRGNIGDVRLNWELNRHYQFPMLARDYLVTGRKKYLDELTGLFSDWNDKNPFLWGISWTSAMEIAIRSVSWLLTLSFLEALKDADNTEVTALKRRLRTGITNMTEYIIRHASRFSSANNHLIVEMTAVGLAGHAFGNRAWQDLAFRTLDEELSRQNSPEGVNLEMSLHYHAFVMEAYMLMIKAMRHSGTSVPERWETTLSAMARFLSCSITGNGQAIEFGDSDEGKIADLSGEGLNYYRYVLQFVSLLTGKRHDAFTHVEGAIECFFTPEEIDAIRQSEPFTPPQAATFGKEGYTFLRNTDGTTVIGIDHAPLGFGSIAAHGHADAMSIQLHHNGRPILADSGTYLYHCPPETRNRMRSELSHNTVCHSGHPQSEMLGAFLWGKKGTAHLETEESSPDADGTRTLAVTGRTYDGCVMRRHITFDPELTRIEITDLIHSADDTVTFITPLKTVTDGETTLLGDEWTLTTHGQESETEQIEISPSYGILVAANAIRLRCKGPGESKVTIELKPQHKKRT